jgi:CheY-like chemotaxis protein
MESGDAPPSYTVSCCNCRALFDALDTSWCNCLDVRRSLVCPSCLTCFCRAPSSYKQGFWEKAPQILWDLAAVQHPKHYELPANPDPAAVQHPLVLVVDDEKEIQRLALHAIVDLGFGGIIAGDGEQGLELARRYRPELVLTDAFMPKLDGREMCRLIKADPVTAGTKVVVMTSLYTASRYKYEAFRDFHADDYLAKPLEFKQLQAMVEKYLAPA